MDEDILLFSFLENIEDKLIRFGKFALIGIFFWVVNTNTIKVGLSFGINLWLLTFFNMSFWGFLKFLVLEKTELFKRKK